MGIFDKIFSSLKKTKDTLARKLSALFAKNKLGDDFFEELEEILISSDMSVSTAMEISQNLQKLAVLEKLKDKDYVFSLLKQEIKNILSAPKLPKLTPPTVMLIVGVNGVGKTTTIGKLANLLVTEKKSVIIAAADTFRAAAADQLTIWADRANVKIIKQSEGSDPSAVVFDAVSSAKARGCDVLIIDTAGRLHVKSNLMEELKKMSRIIENKYPEAQILKLIVLDATTGHNALNQVKAFGEAIGIDAIILTKLDGTAKGGFVVSLAADLDMPVMYAGTGEKIGDIAVFDTDEFAEGLI